MICSCLSQYLNTIAVFIIFIAIIRLFGPCPFRYYSDKSRRITDIKYMKRIVPHIQKNKIRILTDIQSRNLI